MSDISREDEIIGANVKKFRESQGISRKDLAHIFHISEDGVYRIERGETGLSSAYAYILANQLHCDMNFIYGLTTDPICLNMECMDKEQLTPENAISKIRWYTDVLVLYNTEKFLQNKKLEKLADIRKGESTMKEFDMNDLLG